MSHPTIIVIDNCLYIGSLVGVIDMELSDETFFFVGKILGIHTFKIAIDASDHMCSESHMSRTRCV